MVSPLQRQRHAFGPLGAGRFGFSGGGRGGSSPAGRRAGPDVTFPPNVPESGNVKSVLTTQKNGAYTDGELEPALIQALGKHYLGLLMGSDFVPPTPPGGTYLVNLDSRSGGGTHWGILRRSAQFPRRWIWNDSLGLMPPKPITHSVRTRFSGTPPARHEVYANDAADQRITNTKDALCGPRAVIFAQEMAANPKKDFARFLQLSKDW